MTKLTEWISVALALLSIWLSIVGGYVHGGWIDRWMFLIVPSPIIFVGLFGLYAVCVILYRVFTFNDCEYAAKELQEQIVQARDELTQKGFVF